MTAIRVAAKALFATVDVFLPPLQGPRILIYHQVGSGRSHEMNVTVEAFRRQLAWMQSNGEIVGLEEGVNRRGEANSDQLFVLTFDDGYADVFVNAFPLMARQKIPFTLYLTSGPIEDPGDFPTWPGDPLTWDQVRSMIDSGLVTVGAHTHTHADLRLLTGDAVVDELDRSNGLIATRTGVVPEHFTYPKGFWAPRADAAVRHRYQTATVGGRNPGPFDRHKINRVPVQGSDITPLFGPKMRSGGRFEDRVRQRVNGKTRRGPRSDVAPAVAVGYTPLDHQTHFLNPEHPASAKRLERVLDPILTATRSNAFVMAGADGWTAAVEQVISQGGRVALGINRPLARRLLGSATADAFPARKIRPALSELGASVAERYSIWPSLDAPRLVFRSPVTGWWLHQAGIIGGGRRSSLRQLLARSFLSAPFVSFLAPSSIWVVTG